eukprot:1159636-Pelagomonas_calceolata.AAC.2
MLLQLADEVPLNLAWHAQLWRAPWASKHGNIFCNSLKAQKMDHVKCTCKEQGGVYSREGGIALIISRWECEASLSDQAPDNA